MRQISIEGGLMVDAPDTTLWKREAARRALVAVHPGMVVGLGTGSTAEQMIALLGERVRAGLTLRAVATSWRSETAARAEGIPLLALEDVDWVDVTIDGADEIELTTLNVLKGRGGALLREKLVARASRLMIIAADDSKPVSRLGERNPIPIEVTPFGWRQAARAVEALGARSAPVLRVIDRERGAARPFETDNYNYVLDCDFGPLDDPAALERELKLTPGVVDSGLFIGLARQVVVAGAGGVRVFERPT